MRSSIRFSINEFFPKPMIMMMTMNYAAQLSATRRVTNADAKHSLNAFRSLFIACIVHYLLCDQHFDAIPRK